MYTLQNVNKIGTIIKFFQFGAFGWLWKKRNQIIDVYLTLQPIF
jgi:hypothetical protein